MAISYVGGKGAGTAGQGGGSISLTTGLTGGSGGAPIAGDLVVVTVCVATAGRQPGNLGIDTPSGYTALTIQRTTATAYDVNVCTSYKVMASTPDTSVTINASGNNADGIAYIIQVFRGVHASTPMDATPTYTTGSGTNNRPDPAEILPVTAGAWIVVCGGGAAATGGTFLTPSDLTNFLAFTGADTNDASVGAGYNASWTSGAFNPLVFQGGNNVADNSWGATTLALRPAVELTVVGADLAGAYAIDAAVGQDLAGTYGVVAPVGRDQAGAYAVLVAAGQDLAGTYAVVAPVGADLAGGYGMAGAVGANLAGAYGIQATVGADLVGGAAVLNAAGADLPGAYAVVAAVGQSLAGSYAVVATVGQNLAGGYDVVAVVGADITGAYALVGAATTVGADLTGGYGLVVAVGQDLAGAYAISEPPAFVGADLLGSYQVLQAVGVDLAGQYLIDSNIRRAPPGAGHQRPGAATQRPASTNTTRAPSAGATRPSATLAQTTNRRPTDHEPQTHRRPRR